jgi:hypothetical protein
MKTKNLMVFFLTIVSILLVTTSVNAETSNLADITKVEINGIVETGNQDISFIAGEYVFVHVYFTSSVNASNVNIKAELDGEKTRVYEVSGPFDVEDGKKYLKVLKIKSP